MTIDPTNITLDDLPPDWTEIPPEILARLLTAGPLMTTEETAAINRIAQGRWFLIRNDLRIRCHNSQTGTGCGAVHDYISLRCVEAPFNGLRQLELFTQKVAGADVILTRMDIGTLVPISASKARKFNERIIERGGRTIQQQIPIRPDEIDPDAMRRRIVERTRGLRDMKGAR